MNSRILELVQKPELFQLNDLELIATEIEKAPYAQSLRALQLYGTHRLRPEDYQHQLSITAAYTTDKKILYQLINSLPAEQVSTAENKHIAPAAETIEIISDDNDPSSKFTEITVEPTDPPKPIYVDGELNRILFPGEEDFLNQPAEEIDMESTIESGQIVTTKSADEENTTGVQSKPEESLDAETFSKEIITSEKQADSETEIVQNLQNTSFHEVEKFDETDKSESENKNDNQQNINEIAETSTPENIDNEVTAIVNNEKNNNQLTDGQQTPPTPTNQNSETNKLSENATPETINNEKDNSILSENQNSLNNSDEFTESADAENFSKEKIIDEDHIAEEKPAVENSAEISFHGTDDFLPEVKITPAAQPTNNQPPKKPILNKHEEEMNRLIAEVEAKMKSAKKVSPAPDSTSIAEGSEINFSENTHPIPNELESSQEKHTESKQENSTIRHQKVAETKETAASEEISNSWKPMSFDVQSPDSLIEKNPETSTDAPNRTTETTVPPSSEPSLEQKNPIDSRATAISEESKTHSASQKETPAETEISNIPAFINTWQNWLQIDRTKNAESEKTKISITEIKNKVIDQFIENEPKISKLKEESDFVIKERNDDISHLMTETLAQLYVEQKLYSKAIKAYEILIKKHPEKKAHFKTKIQEVKDIRQNK